MGNLEARFREKRSKDIVIDAHGMANNPPLANTLANNPTQPVANKLKRDRRAYQRDLMRRRRAAKKLEDENAGRTSS